MAQVFPGIRPRVYSPKLPIRGGGGHVSRVDTSQQPGKNPIVEALMGMMAQKNKDRQFGLDERRTAAYEGLSQARIAGLGRTKASEERTEQDIIAEIAKLTALIDKLIKGGSTAESSRGAALLKNRRIALRDELGEKAGVEITGEPRETLKLLGIDWLWPDKESTLKVEPKKSSKGKASGKKVSGTSVLMETAPDVRLNPYWGKLDDVEKQEIAQALQINPKSIDEILRRLKSGKVQ